MGRMIRQKSGGSALITVIFASLILVAAIGVIAFSLIVETASASSFLEGLQAFYTAESGRFIAQESVFQFGKYVETVKPWEEASPDIIIKWFLAVTGGNINGDNIGDVDIDIEGNVKGWPYTYWLWTPHEEGQPVFDTSYYISDFTTRSRGYVPRKGGAEATRCTDEVYISENWYIGPYWDSAFSKAEASSEAPTYWGKYPERYYAYFAIDHPYYPFYYPPWWWLHWYYSETYWASQGGFMGGTPPPDITPWIKMYLEQPNLANTVGINYRSWGLGGGVGFQSATISVKIGNNPDFTAIAIQAGMPAGDVASYPINPDNPNAHYWISQVRVDFVAQQGEMPGDPGMVDVSSATISDMYVWGALGWVFSNYFLAGVWNEEY